MFAVGPGKLRPACSLRISLKPMNGVKMYRRSQFSREWFVGQGRMLIRAKCVKTIASAGKTSIASADGMVRNCRATHADPQTPCLACADSCAKDRTEESCRERYWCGRHVS